MEATSSQTKCQVFKTLLHIGERISYGFALRTENSAIFEGTEFSQSAPCVSAGKLCAQRTNLTILIKFLQSQNGRRCKKMQKDFAQVRNVFQLSTQRMRVNIVSRSSYKAKKR